MTPMWVDDHRYLNFRDPIRQGRKSLFTNQDCGSCLPSPFVLFYSVIPQTSVIVYVQKDIFNVLEGAHLRTWMFCQCLWTSFWCRRREYTGRTPDDNRSLDLAPVPPKSGQSITSGSRVVGAPVRRSQFMSSSSGLFDTVEVPFTT